MSKSGGNGRTVTHFGIPNHTVEAWIWRNAALFKTESDKGNNCKIDIDAKQLAQIKGQKGIVMVYLVNSECSTCIADYIRFLKMADKIEVDNISIYGVLNKNHTTLLDYYLEQYNTKSLEKTTPVHILTESSYPFGNNEPLKNLIISNGSLVNKITFSDNTLIFH